jgi:hypothetical protein
MIKNKELSKIEMLEMIERASSTALEMCHNKVIEEEEAKTFEKINDFFQLVRSNPDKYQEIDLTKLMRTYLEYTQMICLLGMGIELKADKIRSDDLQPLRNRIEKSKLELLGIAGL